MTNTEKMIMNDKDAKKALQDVLKMFDGTSHKFATDVVRAALKYLTADSIFNYTRASENIESLTNKKKYK